MRDISKTKKQLIEELSDLRARVADLEKGNGSKSDPCRHIEMRLADLIELVPEIIFETDPRGNLFFANQTAFNTFGYTQDDIDNGMNILDVVVPDERDTAMEYMRRLADGGRSETNEYTARRKDGSIIPVVVHSKAIYDDKGKHIGFRGVVLDVTERKRVEEALRESIEKLRIIFESVGIGITITDMNGRILDTNETTLRMKGYSAKEEVVGRNGFDFISERDRAKAMDLWVEVMETGVGMPVEIALLTKDGREVETECLSTVLHDSCGNPVGLITVESDISGRKRMEEVLRESEEKLRAIFESAAAGITINDFRGTILDVNTAAVQLHGFNSKDEMIGRNAFKLISEKDHARAKENGAKILKGELVREVSEHYTLLRADGSEFEAAVSESVLRDKNGDPEGFISITRDITERKQAEEALKHSEEKYRELVEMERDVIFAVDEVGNITAINSATRVWGYEPEEVIGKNFLELIPEEWREKTAVELQSRLLEAGEITAETVVVDWSGEQRPIEYSAVVVKEDDKYLGARGIVRDVTERKKAEEMVKKTAEELQMILDSVPAFIYYKDTEGRIVRGNKAIADAARVPRDKWMGKTVFELMPSLAERYHADDMEVISTGQPKRNIIEPLETPKGIRWLHSDKLPTRDEKGNVTGLIGFSVDITDRVQAGEALKQSEEKLRFMLESIADGITVTDLGGKIEDVNGATLNIYGYGNKDEVIGKNGVEFIAEEDRARVMDDLAKAAFEGRTKVVEYKMVGSGGREFYGEVSGAVLRDTAGGPTGFITAIRDVTERKRLEEAQLWESEEKRRIVFESIADGIVIMDMEGMIIDANEAAYRMGGWSCREDIIGKNGFSFVADKDQTQFARDFAKVLKEQRSIMVQYAVKDKEGKEYESETVATLLHDTSGRPIGFVTVVRDISERKRMEEKLRESEELSRGMLESAATGMYVLQKGRFRYVSPLFEAITGYKSKELIGKRSLDFIHPDDRELVRKRAVDSLKGKSRQPHEFRFVRKDGNLVWILEKVASIQYEGKKATIASFMDVTDMKRTEEELRMAQEYMIQSERLRALGEMASGVAHDFNNILAVVLGRAQLALEDVGDPKLKKDLQVIEQTALDAASTVRRLQDFSRVRVDRSFEAVDIGEVVASALHMVESRKVELKETAGIGIDIVAEVGELPHVRGDAAELREALLNILFNSIDAMPEGGKITIRGSRDNRLVTLSVSDTGVGIPPGVRGKIFEPFFTTKGRSGSGLGLSVAYGIVKRCGGTIEAESDSGRGTTITIKLPIARGVEVKKRPKREPAAARSLNILLVDDDPEVKDMLKLMLEHLGHKVTGADSGEAAVNTFEAGDFELVITDLGMPDMSGREVAQIVKEIKLGTPVLLITGWGVQLDKEEMEEIDGVIAKPFSKDVLSAKIAELISGDQ
jgi:PAS domain S-box-containing protein